MDLSSLPEQPRGPDQHDQRRPAEIRVTDPGSPHLALTWQARDSHGHQASGQLTGAPPTPQGAGWRYPAFADAAQAAIAALEDLEAAQRQPGAAGHDRPGADPARRTRTCDFCAAAPAAWRYPTRRGQLATVLIGDALVIMPGGDWHACPTCHHLVQASRWEALNTRAGLPHDQGAALWATFQAARAGTPTPLDPQGHHDQDGGAG